MTDSASNTQLSEADVRAVVRLLGEVAAMRGDIPAKKRRLMDGLNELVGADMWVCAVATINTAQRIPSVVSLQHEGLSPEQAAAMARYGQDLNQPPPENVLSARLVEQHFHWTRRRDQMISDEQWYGDTVNVQRHREMGYDDFLYSSYPLDEPGVYSIFGFYRHFGRAGFTDRDCRLVHIVTAEVDWLHYEHEPMQQESRVFRLSPRLRAVLVLLLDGWDRKSIARHMHLSPHTVGDYMKQLYQHFGVDGHVALLRRFMTGAHADGDTEDDDASD